MDLDSADLGWSDGLGPWVGSVRLGGCWFHVEAIPVTKRGRGATPDADRQLGLLRAYDDAGPRQRYQTVRVPSRDCVVVVTPFRA